MKRILGKPNETNKTLISLIERVKINNFYLKNRKDFRDQILEDIEDKDDVLDIGKAMRDRHSKIICRSLETLDVNDFGSYPDIICDICSNIDGLENKYDKIICIAILLLIIIIIIVIITVFIIIKVSFCFFRVLKFIIIT